MAYDSGIADLMREDLADTDGITEKAMFGGIAFLLRGHMVTGVGGWGATYRVGKDREAEARAIPGTGPFAPAGRPMGGWVAVDDEVLADDGARARLLGWALSNAESLPPKG